jgi:septal ring factor EnvC (AmiA/AmiB activator)
MSRWSKVLVVAIVSVLGIWGCAKGPGQQATTERTRVLEQKIAKLEQDFTTATVAREELQQRLTTVEVQRTRLEKEVTDLRVVVKERDVLQVQYDQFRKTIREALGQAEAGLGANGAPATAAKSQGTAPGNS